ncbi:hypothetical protein KY345_05445 [Candidatus Woesearchaeota archaeon]|nr:hypothetical protein [Candidatus Woesearchaeota archaeon]
MSISHKRDEVIKRGRNRSKRPKTFKTEQAAAAYAKANNIANYILKNLKNQEAKNKKLIIVKK